jgi:hypothetical protein
VTPPAIAAAMSAGRLVASAIGLTPTSLVVASAKVRASCAISLFARIGPSAWFSSAPPFGIVVMPVSGSMKLVRARPSQNSSGNQAAVRKLGDARLVTWMLSPKVASGR